MTKGQRKMHLTIWILLAICIPVGFISAIVVIPKENMQENVFLSKPVKLERLLAENQEDNVIVLLRSNEEMSKYQLEVLITTPFKTPDIGVYIAPNQDFDIQESYLLGNIAAKGEQLFHLPLSLAQNDNIQVVLFDPIRNEILNQISLKL